MLVRLFGGYYRHSLLASRMDLVIHIYCNQLFRVFLMLDSPRNADEPSPRTKKPRPWC